MKDVISSDGLRANLGVEQLTMLEIGSMAFEVLMPGFLGMNERRLLTFDTASGYLVVAALEKSVMSSTAPEAIPLQDVTHAELSTARVVDLKLLIHAPARAMTVSFRSLPERHLFASCLHFCSPTTRFTVEGESQSGGGQPRFTASAPGTMGIHREVTLGLFSQHGILDLGGGTFADMASATIVEHPTNERRLVLEVAPLSVTEEGGTGMWLRKVRDVAAAVKALRAEQQPSKSNMTLTFSSLWSRERFTSRLRACARRFDPTRPDAVLDLPVGEEFRILCGTFNVGDKGPPKDAAKLQPWLRAGEYDIYAIGFQENSQRKKWVARLQQYFATAPCPRRPARLGALEEDEPAFCMLGMSLLWDIHVYVFVRADLRQRISRVSTATRATGMGNILGNKGGAALGFTLDGSTTFAFVTSHLAARATRRHTRQENYEDIVHGLPLTGNAHVPGADLLHAFDHVFWFGDLNYRVEFGNHGEDWEFAMVRELARAKEFDRLVARDQLSDEMRRQRAFLGFQEGPIAFPPTYRYLKGKPEFSNKKNQNPSYCDRVLWRSAAALAGKVRQTHYDGCFELNFSDHRPVAAGFCVEAAVPHVCRQSNERVGVWDTAAVVLDDVVFKVAPDVSSSRTTTERYDGYTGPMCLKMFGSWLPESTSTAAPAPCENPAVATSMRSNRLLTQGKGAMATASDAGATTSTLQSMQARRKKEQKKDKHRVLPEEDDLPDILDPKHSELPSWSWSRDDVQVLFSTVPDCEWLASQTLSVTVNRGSADGAAVGIGEISLEDAFEGMCVAHEVVASTLEGSFDEREATFPAWIYGAELAEDIKLFRQGLSMDMGSNMAAQAKAMVDRIKRRPFTTKVLRRGKWVGTLFGSISMHYMPGLSPAEDEEDVSEKIRFWRAMQERVNQQAKGLICRVEHAEERHRVVATARKAAELPSLKMLELESMGTPPSAGQRARASFELSREAPAPLESDGALVVPADTQRASQAVFSRDGANSAEQEIIEAAEARDGASVPFRVYRFEANRHRFEEISPSAVGPEESEGGSPSEGGEHSEGDEPSDEDSDDEYEGIVPPPPPPVDAFGNAGEGAAPLNAEVFAHVPLDDEVRSVLVERSSGGPTKAGASQPGTAGLQREVSSPTYPSAEDASALLACRATGEPLLDEFVLFEGRPYSRDAFLKKFRGQLCAGCLRPFSEGEDTLSAIDQKWHAGCFRCADSGKVLSTSDSFYAVKGKPYSEDSYRRLFQACCVCGESVTTVQGGGERTPDSGVRSMGKLWHRRCFACARCRAPLDGQAHYPWSAADGSGEAALCEGCFLGEMPVCPGCSAAVNTLTDPFVEACGGTWHAEHFRCASSGVLLDDCYYEHDGYPYTEEAFLDRFGERCVECKEVISGDIIRVLGQCWHPEHFRCASSGRVIEPDEDGVLNFYEHKLQPYTRSEYARLFCKPCAACGDLVIDDALEVRGRVWHPACLRCVACDCSLRFADTVCVSENGDPYCFADFIGAFGSVCPGCNHPIMPEEPSLDALGKTWHAEHFLCMHCQTCVADKPFVQVADHVVCEACYVAEYAQSCMLCMEKISPDEAYVTLPTQDGSTRHFHRRCYGCVACGKIFADGDSILVKDDLPYDPDCFSRLFATAFCAMCKKPVLGKCVRALGKDWHLEHLQQCFVCAERLPKEKMFAWNAPPDIGTGQWPVCKEHLLSRADALPPAAMQCVTCSHQDLEGARSSELSAHNSRLDGLRAQEKRASQRRVQSIRCQQQELRKRYQEFTKSMKLSRASSIGPEGGARPGAARGAAVQALTMPASSRAQPGDEGAPAEEERAATSPLSEPLRPPRPPRPPRPSLPPATRPPPPPVPPALARGEPPSSDTGSTSMPGAPRAPAPPRPSAAGGASPADAPAPGDARLMERTAVPAGRASLKAEASGGAMKGIELDDQPPSMLERRTAHTLFKAGWLEKKGGGTAYMGRRDWRRRYFVLCDSLLRSYVTEADYHANSAIKAFAYDASACTVSALGDGRDSRLLIAPNSDKGGPRPMILRAGSEADRDSWIDALSGRQ